MTEGDACTLAKDPRKSIYGGAANRAEASDCKSAAIYNLLGTGKFNKDEILRAHRAAAIRRMEGRPLIVAVRDTTSVNYDSRQKTEGNGYISGKTMGVNRVVQKLQFLNNSIIFSGGTWRK
jgi:hypothetical protein